MKRSPQRARGETLGDRFMGVLASLLFSVPTFAVIWFGINRRYSGGEAALFLSLDWLLGAIAVSTVIAFVSPRFFASLFGRLWRGLWFWH